MGGSIGVDSAPGKGSIFRVELPVNTADKCELVCGDSGCDESVDLAAGQPECRILIVEDQRENSLLLVRLLRSAGFRHARSAERR